MPTPASTTARPTARLQPAPPRRRHRVAFLRQVLRNPTAMGAVAPTSSVVARTLAGLVPPEPELVVVELGAGTGAISAAVGPRLGPGARHIALERDPVLLAALERTAPWARRVVGDAADLAERLAELDVHGTDVVLSSLPWSNFAPGLQERILVEVRRVLARDGVFATVAYRPTRLMPRSRAFRAALRAGFGEVVATSTVWANLPPARLYVCRRPHPVPPRG